MVQRNYLKLLFKIIIFFLLTWILIVVAMYGYKVFRTNGGTTIAIEGTISDKQHIAAHTTTSGCLFFFSTEYHSDKYTFTIRRYDNGKKAWETATVDVDEDTYNKYAKNDHYSDPSGKTAFFHFQNNNL